MARMLNGTDKIPGLRNIKGVIVYERLNSSPYSNRMLDSFKIDGVIRIAPLNCHTVEDIDKFLIIIMELARL